MAKSRSVKIEILPTAQTDLQEIVDFIAQGSVKYSRIEKRLIIGAIERLFTFPELGVSFIYKTYLQGN
jgi:plasmid stabilization system protein ParE